MHSTLRTVLGIALVSTLTGCVTVTVRHQSEPEPPPPEPFEVTVNVELEVHQKGNPETGVTQFIPVPIPTAKVTPVAASPPRVVYRNKELCSPFQELYHIHHFEEGGYDLERRSEQIRLLKDLLKWKRKVDGLIGEARADDSCK